MHEQAAKIASQISEKTQGKIAKVLELLAAANLPVKANLLLANGTGRIIKTEAKGKKVEIVVTDEKVTTDKYAYLMPNNLFMTIEAL